jgi:uncharacterized membrane protein YhaH (DUF805 family)
MPLPKDKAWFPPKTYGWGWGPPRRWQGWIVLLVFFAALVAGMPLAKKALLFYVAYCLALAAVLIAIAYWKGEKPHWSWGKRE